MKSTRRRVTLGFCLAAVGFLSWLPPAKAGDTTFWSAANRDFGATNKYVIVPAVGNRIAVVRTLEASSDLAPGRIGVFTNGPTVVIPYDVSSSNIQVAASGTNGLAASDRILIHVGNVPNDYYHLVRVVTATTTNILYTPTISQTLSAGSKLWKVGTNTFYYGITNAATSPKSSFVAVGEEGKPMLIDSQTSAVGSLNALGTFEPANR